MQAIEAFSLTSHVNEWVWTSDHPRILHIFDNACNLVDERREVISIVTPQIGNGPFNLVVENDIIFSQHLDAETSVSIFENQLLLGDFTLDIQHANIWDPNVDWKKLHTAKDMFLRPLSPFLITDYQPSLPSSLLSDLCTSVVFADLPPGLNATRKLAGLGNGLTPAGDDFILGALYALRIIHLPATANVFATEIAETAASRTTSLSAAWLRSAGRGEAGMLWHEFFAAAVSGEPAQIQASINKILAVGATSGADALTGFTDTLSGYLENIKA